MFDDGEARAHFKRRLESFSDIVFGLSLSQLALLLALPAKAQELTADPLRYFVFFATFGIIAFTWMNHHRMFRLAFDPNPLEIALNFIFLAFVGLLPFAMEANIRFSGDPRAFAIYGAAFAGGSIPMLVILQRGLMRRSTQLTDAERLTLWRAVLRNRFVLSGALLSLVLLAFWPVPIASVPYWFLGPVSGFVRRRVKSVPARYLPAAGAIAP